MKEWSTKKLKQMLWKTKKWLLPVTQLCMTSSIVSKVRIETNSFNSFTDLDGSFTDKGFYYQEF